MACYCGILDSLATEVRRVDVGIRYDNFVETIRGSALAAQTRPLVGHFHSGRSNRMPSVIV
jgi:hypothetical protein